MFPLKSSFNYIFTAKDIAEPIASAGHGDTELIDKYFNKLNFDVIGYREEGRVIGYLEKGKLHDHFNLRDSMKKFELDDLITPNTDIRECLKLLKEKKRLFVIDRSEINGIITLSDRQKPAVRMLFFGVVTIFESQLANLIKILYPNDQWARLLKEERLKNALLINANLERRNQDIDLINCTQLCDKTAIFENEEDLIAELVGLSKNKANYFFYQTNNLRDDLAHALSLDIWFDQKDVMELVDRLIIVTEKMEEKIQKLS